MVTEHLIFLSVPGLRPADIDRGATPTLYQWAGQGAFAEMIPTFPCVTSPVQANMHTGTPPAEHGVIANGFYHRDRREVEFWVGQNTLIAGEQVWDAIHKHRPGFTSAVWHAQNIKGAGADFIVTPAPVHEPDGSMRPWCYSKPDGIYQELLDELGHFPLQHYWGPLANIESTRWILDAAGRLARKHAPNYHWIYIPHLDYAAQRFGPDSDEAKNSLIELDRLLGKFATEVGESSIGKDVVYVVAGEYAMTDVSGVIYPNRVLREAGLLAVREEDGAEHVDLAGSTAFAMVDHQFAHVYVDESKAQALARTCEVLRGTSGIAGVYAGYARAEIDMDHERSGDIVLISEDTRWFAYYWWLDDAAAPPFALTVDIHRKPGYDPVELFFDPATKGILLDAGLVKGSHGVPATGPQHRTALICSVGSDALRSGWTYRDTDIKNISLALLGLESTI